MDNDVDTQEEDSCYTVEIRRCLYGDLNEAVDVIMSSYYVNMKNPWLQMYRLGELNRLQQNFPRMDLNLHCMFVAIAIPNSNSRLDSGNNNNNSNNQQQKRTIIGFCDVDGRTPNRPTGYAYNPRPYVADMCVDPAFRRRGIGQQLMQACEDFSRNVLQQSQIYLRVETKNQAGFQLYTGMGYRQVIVDDDDDDDGTRIGGGGGGDDDDNGGDASKKIILLCKELEEADDSN
jgi:ribosomal protein S18 acetylase RimI-like enzyme